MAALSCAVLAGIAVLALAVVAIAMLLFNQPVHAHACTFGCDTTREGYGGTVYPAQLSPQQQAAYRQEDMRVIARLRDSLRRVDPEVFGRISIYPSAHQSYTDQKRRIFLRLRDRHGRLYPERVLRLVLAHEFSHHISTSEWGHGPVFQANFSRVLRKARDMGVDVASESEVPREYIHPEAEAGW